MARKMTKAPAAAWRAVLTTRSAAGGDERTEYLGPYWRRSDAQGRISNRKRDFGRSWSPRVLVNARIESAQLGDWEEA